MNTSEETTKKTAPHSGERSIAETRAWKLRVLYTGAEGVVAVEPKLLHEKSPLTVGRRRMAERPPLFGGRFVLDDERVSRAHVQVFIDGNRVLIKDLDSTNGSYVNGRRLRSSECWEIADGDLINIGDSLLMLRYEQAMVADVPIPSIVGCSLDEDLRSQQFRKDLYSRLSTDVVRLPPLRERQEDVLLLAQHFGGAGFRPSPRLAEALLRYDWPFNVREVQSVIGRVQRGDVEQVIVGLRAPPRAAAVSLGSTSQERPRPWKAGDPPPPRRHLVDLLDKYRGNLLRIQQEVGYSRRSLRRWTEKYGIDLEEYRRIDESIT